MKTQDLLKLADLLEAVPAEHFDMGIWSGIKKCGFAGCAIGWFCRANPEDKLFLMPIFNYPAMRDGFVNTSPFVAIGARFEISELAATFLFGTSSRDWTGIIECGDDDREYYLSSVLDMDDVDRDTESPLVTAAHIRKFVYCKLHWSRWDFTPGVTKKASNMKIVNRECAAAL